MKKMKLKSFLFSHKKSRELGKLNGADKYVVGK